MHSPSPVVRVVVNAKGVLTKRRKGSEHLIEYMHLGSDVIRYEKFPGYLGGERGSRPAFCRSHVEE